MSKIMIYSPGANGVILLLENGKQEFIETIKIGEVFERFGGSFTQALGIALYRADAKNTLKILTTWEDDIKEFIEKFILVSK